MRPRFLTVLNGLSKSKSHLKEKVALVFNTSYTLPHLPAWQSFLTMPNFALLSTPGALLRKVPPLLRITFVCPLQSGFSFCSPFFRNSACSNLDESHGRKPAMRVSEQVHPTADLIPAPHKMCNKLLKFASYIHKELLFSEIIQNYF